MGVLSRLLTRPAASAELRGNDRTLTSAEIIDLLTGGQMTATGVPVSPEGSLSYTSVLSCVRVLAEGVASLPCLVYQRATEAGQTTKQRALNHLLYPLLHDAPNPVQTAFELHEMGMAHCLLWGNFYAEVEWDQRGQAVALWPLPAWRITPIWSRSGKVYWLEGEMKPFADYQILHIPGFGYDGTAGKSMIRLAREAVGLGLAAQRYGAAFFGNGARPGVVLEHPGQLSDQAHNHLLKSWNERHEGLSNAHRVAILEEGMKLQTLGIPPEDAQFLETRQFQRSEIAAIFRVPPHMIGDLERATFSNIEQQSQDFYTNTLQPWLKRWEQRLMRTLLIGGERKQYFIEYLVDALLRGDMETRYQSYSVGRNGGWLSVNDIRRMENMNPVDGGDIYLQPLNMVEASQTATASGKRELRSASEVERTADERRRMAGSFRRALKDVAQRIINREINDIRNAARKRLKRSAPAKSEQRSVEMDTWLDDFYRDHSRNTAEYLLPTVLSQAELVSQSVERETGHRWPDGDLSRWVDGYTEGRANAWCADHRRRLQAALAAAEAAGDDQLAALEAELDAMAEREAEQIADDQSVRIIGAVATTIYAFFALRMVWHAFGDSCDYCASLNGRVVSSSEWFANAGDVLLDAAGAALRMSGNVRHAPLHGGCDCVVLAA